MEGAGAVPPYRERQRLSGGEPYMTLPTNKWVWGAGGSSRDDLDSWTKGRGEMEGGVEGRTSSDEGKKRGFLERELLLLLLLHTALPLHSCVPVTKRACARVCVRERAREAERDREEKGKGGVLICVLCCTATALRAE